MLVEDELFPIGDISEMFILFETILSLSELWQLLFSFVEHISEAIVKFNRTDSSFCDTFLYKCPFLVRDKFSAETKIGVYSTIFVFVLFIVSNEYLLNIKI